MNDVGISLHDFNNDRGDFKVVFPSPVILEKLPFHNILMAHFRKCHLRPWNLKPSTSDTSLTSPLQNHMSTILRMQGCQIGFTKEGQTGEQHRLKCTQKGQIKKILKNHCRGAVFFLRMRLSNNFLTQTRILLPLQENFLLIVRLADNI